jgi:hypothetical protein
MQLNTFLSDFLVQIWVVLKQQILDGFTSFIGMLTCACSNLVFHFTVSLSTVLCTIMVRCPLCICVIFSFA